MKSLLIRSGIASALLILGLSVRANGAPQRYVFREDANMLFSQVRSDLDRAQHDAFPRDTDSIEKARGELNELERQWDARAYTPRQADYVVSALERVLSENHLSFRDHNRLSDDLRRMRDFRDRHQ